MMCNTEAIENNDNVPTFFEYKGKVYTSGYKHSYGDDVDLVKQQDGTWTQFVKYNPVDTYVLKDDPNGKEFHATDYLNTYVRTKEDFESKFKPLYDFKHNYW